MILTPLQKLPKNGEDWAKLIVAKGFKKLPKVQIIAQSGHTDQQQQRTLALAGGSQSATFYLRCAKNQNSYSIKHRTKALNGQS